MEFMQFDRWTCDKLERLVQAMEEHNELLRKQNEHLANIAGELRERRIGPRDTSYLNSDERDFLL